ncbi:DUF5819 family protein [Streptomyces sp. t39]|uniref:DUF5819 family protein n=1 Tax=Streptomyces sp. t39 TaxID=1828156 RepID=UPI0011CDEEF0|nr:DUF5819 family protein [Streptomyces sp. t39]TXS56031.1 hypothetical protein EAO77_07710 [Streptomyces sp. t39]
MRSYEHEDGTGVGSLGSGPPPPRTPESGESVPAGPAPAESASARPATAGPAPVSPGSAEPSRTGAEAGESDPTVGIAALSLPYQVVAAIGLALVGVFACVHLAMVFLHVAPANTVTRSHGDAVRWWVFPEFEQNWRLFAPNPLQQNVAVEVRAEYLGADGQRRTTGWIDMTAQDAEAIRGNLFPSHVHQNQLRRGWDFYLGSHDADNRPSGVRGRLAEQYLRRIAMQRLDGEGLDGPVQRVQLRSSSRSVKAPEWSAEKTDTRPVHRVLEWWTITPADLPEGVGNGRTEALR